MGRFEEKIAKYSLAILIMKLEFPLNKFIVTTLIFASLLLINPAYVSSFTNDQKASYVIGQKDFKSMSPNGGELTANQFSFYGPSGIAFDKEGNLWVAELMNNRILGFYAPPASWGTSIPISKSAGVVIGQKDFTTTDTNSGGLSASSLESPLGMKFDLKGNLWVTDSGNNRILRYSAPLRTGQSADLVIGQKDFVSNNYGVGGERPSNGTLNPPAAPVLPSADTLHTPYDLAFDSSGNLWVADTGNNRVLKYSAPLRTGQSADLVIGQKDFVSGEINSGGLSANSLNNPRSVSLSGNELWIGDYKNGRILGYNPCVSSSSLNATLDIPSVCTVPGNIASGQSADIVLGKKDFTSTNTPYPTLISSLNSPFGIVFDSSGNLWITDEFKESISEFKPLDICSGRRIPIVECHQYLGELANVYADAKLKTVEFRNEQTPSLVIGKSASDGMSTGAGTLRDPSYLAFDPHSNLWVSDFRNNRVLKYDNFPIILLAPTNGTR